MIKIEELQINKMPKISSKKDVEKLFEPGNFLYCIIKDNKALVKELKASDDYNYISDDINSKINEIAKLEWAYIPHNDELIHNWNRPKQWYKDCGLPEFKPEDERKTNDMLTSSSYAKKLKEKFDFDEYNKYFLNFLAINHTIGNMLTAKRNWLRDTDVAACKLNKIWKYYFEDKNAIAEESQKEICKAYSENEQTKSWNGLIENLYLIDFCDTNNMTMPLKHNSKLLLFYAPNDDNWSEIDAHNWLENNTKLIIQRGYRMQKQHKNYGFEDYQKDELKIIFEYFGFKDTNVI